MVPILIRSIILIGAVVLQTSFFVNLFAPPFVPLMGIALAISWVLVRNFQRAFVWLIILGITLDIVNTNVMGVSVLMIMLIGYGAGFLSKRFLTTHHLWGVVSLSFYVIGASIAMILFDMLVRDGIWPFETILGVIGYSFLNVIVFFLVFKVVRFSENYLSLFERRIDVKRHV